MKLLRALSAVFLTLLLLLSPMFGQKGTYKNKAGRRVQKPIHFKGKQIPVGVNARCRDGSFSFSQNRRGTCSHHGGVAAWLK